MVPLVFRLGEQAHGGRVELTVEHLLRGAADSSSTGGSGGGGSSVAPAVT